MADAAITVLVPPYASARRNGSCARPRSTLARGIAAARAGRPVNAIGRAVGPRGRRDGFTVLRALSGHGIGRTIHEPPTVLNYDEPRLRGRLTPGS